MAAVANCPQCDHELLIPDGTDSMSWAKCPTCRAFFQLRDAASREVPQLVILERESSAPPDDKYAEAPAYNEAPRDREPIASGNADTVVETQFAASETEVAPACPSVDEILSRYKQDLDRLAAGLGDVPVSSTTEATGTSPLAEESSRQFAGDAPVDDPQLSESVERSARKLEHEFRSAETVADLPAFTDEPRDAADDIDFVSRKTVVMHEVKADFDRHTTNVEQEEGELPIETGSASDWSVPFIGEAEAASTAPADVDDETPADSARMVDEGKEGLPVDADADAGATVEFSADALHHMSVDADFEVKQDEIDADRPTWDDPDRMERLLADVEAPPSNLPTVVEVEYEAEYEFQDDLDGELEYASGEVEEADEQEADYEGDCESIDEGVDEVDYQADYESANVTEPVVEAILTNGVEHRRRRSPVMMLAGMAAGGIVGLGLGYLVLLWSLGPSGDFLSASRWIPSAMLPASFQSTTPHIAMAAEPTSSPKSLIDDVAASGEASSAAAPIADAPIAEAPIEEVPTIVAADSDSVDAPESREVTASFEAPVVPPTSVETVETSDPTDRYASADRVPSDLPTEPLDLEVESAVPIVSPPAIVAISDAPMVTMDQLAAGFSAAKQAQGGLLRGSLSDPTVQRAKGLSYTKLSQLAELVAFADREMSNPEIDAIKGDATALFRETVADPQIRQEVGYIASKWIESPHRKIGGVFLAGKVESAAPLGPLAELRLDIGSGDPVIVVAPAELASRLGTEPGAIAVAGSIIDNPSQRIEGYAGTATSVVWAGDLIPLD